jgi:ribokinase
MNIVVIGSSNTDMIIQVPRIPKPGETILGGKFSMAAGGKGANQAVAAARAGGDVTFISRVGQDMFGKKAIDGFNNDGINTEYIVFDPVAPSGVAEIFVADDGENSIAVASGANMNLTQQDISDAEKVIEAADTVLMQLEIPLETVETAAKIANQARNRVILNPAPAQPLPDTLLKSISLLTPNESEAELLTGIKVIDENSAHNAAKVLLEKGVQAIVVTLGDKGALLVSNEMSKIIPGYRVEAVDTTAAGDVFNGGLAVALSEGKTLYDAVTFANAAAALSVTALGAQPSAPGREEIMRFLQENI